MSTLLPAAAAPFLYAAFAAVLLAAVSRLLRPLSLPAALALGLLPLAFTGPALLTGRVYAPIDLPFRTAPLEALRQDVGLDDADTRRTRHDVAFQIIPWRKAVRHAIKNGEWPLWNPFILCGDILAAAGQPAPYHPVHLAGYLLPLAASLTFHATAVFFLAGLGAFCFSREIGCRESAAVLGAVAWMFSGVMLFWTGWPIGMTQAFFPLLLFAVRRTAREPGRRSLGLLTAAFVLLLLAGHPESVWHGVAAAMVYGLFELFAAPRRSRRAAVGTALAAGALALLLSAVDLLPFLEAVPQTVEFHGRRMLFANADRSADWPVAVERLRTVAVPFAYGVPWSEWIRDRGFNPVATPAGGVLLAPMLLALGCGRWRGRWLMLGFAVVGTLAYVSAPGLSELLARLPLFDTAINRRLVFVAAFAVSVLAALGAETWARRGGRRLGWLSLAALLAVAALIAGLWPGMRQAGLSADFLRQRTLLELVPPALATGLFFTARSPRLGIPGLVAILLVQRLAVSAELNPTHPPSLFYPPVAEIEALPRQEAPYRVTGLGRSFTPNLSALYEVEDVRGYQALKNLRLYSTLPLWSGLGVDQAYNAEVSDLRRPFLSFLNVRFALVAGRDPPPTDWRQRAAGRGFAIYENPRVLPRAFVPERVRLGEPLERRLRDMGLETDFSRLAWIEEHGPEDELHPPIEPLARALFDRPPASVGDDLPPPNESANGPGRVEVERRGPGLHLEAEMERPGWVVVSQTAWRGWRASTGGRELPLRFANQAFLAFHLPGGRHAVELVYRPRSFVLGRAVSCLTAGVVTLFLLASAWRSGALLWKNPKDATILPRP